MSDTLSRRGFGQATLSSILTATLFQTLFDGDAFAAPIKPITTKWFGELNDLCQSLKGKALSQLQWQNMVTELYNRVELEEMFRLLDFEKLVSTPPSRHRAGEGAYSVQFPPIEGVPTKLAFGRQVFAVNQGSSVVPHGHNNMATCFYVLKGQFHGRHYDRIRDEQTHMIIRPTVDDTFGPTSCTTISDYKDNVHWFKSLSAVSYIFNIHVIDYDIDNGRSTGRVYVDPDGEKLAAGLIRAPLIGGTEAYKKYG